MASSDEEGEILVQYVLDYHFVDDKDSPVPFSNLPVKWNENEELPDSKTLVLRGSCNNGIQTVYLPVIAWKFELCYVFPEISVLTKDKKWIMLQKPRKAFEPIIRKILVTVHWLHFIKKNPDVPQASAWKHLQKTCSSFGAQPSINDLLEHKLLIIEAARRDKEIEESKSFVTFVGKSQEGISSDEVAEAYGEKEEFFDQVCAICDDGGNVLCCNGKCLRSFHPTVADGVESKCASLRFGNTAEYEAIPVFQCNNCIYMQHQCFACGRLGSSARSSSQEVFPCASATCGHFYHPECVARLLHADNETQAEELREKITAGESYACPAHRCFSCKQHEIADIYELQFAVCRRCPKSYHRKCLPRDFVFQKQSVENNVARAWEGLLANKRILIYCMDHTINRKLKTPDRNHLLFPKVDYSSDLIVRERSSEISKKPRKVDRLHDDAEIFCSSVKKKRCLSQDFELLKKSKIIDPAKKTLNKISFVSAGSSTADKRKLLSRDNLSTNLGSSSLKYKQQNIGSSKIKSIIPDKPRMRKADMSLPLCDAEMENRILKLMEDVSSSFDVEEFKRRNITDTHFHYQNKVDKSFTVGLVEGSVKAVRTALQKLEKGCSVDDAQTVCSPEVLRQIFYWKKKLKIYLAPFLYGARYTSFGRHFTQVEKLEEVNVVERLTSIVKRSRHRTFANKSCNSLALSELEGTIVNRVQCYVQHGDMIVDFCCGSNDFSCLLKERLERNGKPCSFKNYDIIQAKNDFNFEKRDWLKVDRNELPDGSRLIMGLNPPFGVNGTLANAFINMALLFEPKLIVLIVPEKTQRLDEKAPYDLIWEDHELLSGKSFYLPGSVDVNDKQMEQWNNNTPPLYLWSRCDWTAKHIAIARQCGHLSN